MNSFIKKILVTLVAFLIIVSTGFGIYVSDYYKPNSNALAALKSDDEVKVSEYDHYYLFKGKSVKAGIVFYPGGKVDERSYAPLMRMFVKAGYEVMLVKMPFRLAIFGLNRASEIKKEYPDIHKWYIGGHSFGGAMAARYVAKNKGFDGLFLLASYSTSSIPKNMKCISLYGSKDHVLNHKSYKKYHDNLPRNTKEFIIEGGNHSQFGNYGFQEGDHKASINYTNQQRQTVRAIESNF